MFLTFFYFFHVFYLKKTLSNAKYKYVKIQRKIFLEDDLAMIFIDFGVLRSQYCKLSYLLAEEHWSHTNLGIWQPTYYDSVCKDNSWIHGKCRQRFFYPTFTNVFFIFSRVFFTFFNVFFFNFHLNVYYIYDQKSMLHSAIRRCLVMHSCARPNGPHYGSCPSIRPSVRLCVSYWLLTKKTQKIKIGESVVRDTSYRCANSEFNMSNVSLQMRSSVVGVYA